MEILPEIFDFIRPKCSFGASYIPIFISWHLSIHIVSEKENNK